MTSKPFLLLTRIHLQRIAGFICGNPFTDIRIKRYMWSSYAKDIQLQRCYEICCISVNISPPPKCFNASTEMLRSRKEAIPVSFILPTLQRMQQHCKISKTGIKEQEEREAQGFHNWLLGTREDASVRINTLK